jgi:hypothetical protein
VLSAHTPKEGGLSFAISRAVFIVSAGMRAVTFDSMISDHLDSIQRAWFPAVERLFTFGDRVPLRVDLGQSQSGNSSLSPQACRVENTTAELAVSEILPITSVRAPRYFGRRSVMGAKVFLSKVAGQIGGLRLPRSNCGQSSFSQQSIM